MIHNERVSFKTRLTRSWLLCKSSWRVLKLDKELLAIPFISGFINIAAFAAAVYILFASGLLTYQLDSENFGVESQLGWWLLPILFVASLPFVFITTILTAAITHGALERFEGGDPTVKGSVTAALKRWKPLLFFGLMMSVVGIIIDTLQEQASRIPFVGGFIAELLIGLAGMAWNIANFFSIAHIMRSEKELSPIAATKRSVSTIKKVWGEGIASNLGLGLVFGVLLVLTFISGAVGAGFAYDSVGTGLAIGVGATATAMLIVWAVLSETLGAILTAALFFYAETGKAPETFDRDLPKASMTRGKARKVFGGVSKDKTWA